MKIFWYGHADVILNERVKRVVIPQLRRIPINRLLKLREYEETGDAILLDRPRPEEGVVIKTK